MPTVTTATLEIETPSVFLPLLEPARYKGAWGGRGAAKSHFFAELLIEQCIRVRGTRWLCAREIQKSLKDSVKQLLEDKIEKFGVGHLFDVKETEIVTPGNGIIWFHGLQQHTVNSIKSLEGAHGAWVEEAQSLSQRSLTLLLPTVRTPESEIWFSWNPRLPTDPVDLFLRGPGHPEPPIAHVVHANYTDNPWFAEPLRGEMERDRARDPDKYAHVWLGGYERHSEARVFKNWRVCKTAEMPQPSPRTVFYFGADWGFSVDPTVLVRCWIDGRTLYVDREVYEVGCEIDATPALFDALELGQARRWPIIADSARPEIISFMRRHGYPSIQPARKGTGSVEEGVTFLQNYDIVVDEQCQHTIEELTLYSYETDKLTGAILPLLEDKKNHVIDALRYAVESLRAVKPVLSAVGSVDKAWQNSYFKR